MINYAWKREYIQIHIIFDCLLVSRLNADLSERLLKLNNLLLDRTETGASIDIWTRLLIRTEKMDGIEFYEFVL